MVILKWSFLILIVFAGFSSLAADELVEQILRQITQERAEAIIGAQNTARVYLMQIFSSIQEKILNFNRYNTIINNIIKGLQTRDLDPLKIVKDRTFFLHNSEPPPLKLIAKVVYNLQGCNEATDFSISHWEMVLRVIPDVTMYIPPVPRLGIEDQEYDIIEQWDRPITDIIFLAVNYKYLNVSLNLIQYILVEYPFTPYTPDLVVLIRNVNERLRSQEFQTFQLESSSGVTPSGEIPADTLKRILTVLLNRNNFEPQMVYQINHLLSALKVNRRAEIGNSGNSISEWFSAMEDDGYPQDILLARNDLKEGISNNSLSGVDLNIIQEDMRGYSPLERLLGLLARLMNLPAENVYSAKVHAIYPHVKLRYLANMENYFVPNTVEDLIFLLNSFLTVKNDFNNGMMQQIHEMFLSRSIDWERALKDFNYVKYSKPRTLFLEVLRGLQKSTKLPPCYTITVEYFLKNNNQNTCANSISSDFLRGGEDVPIVPLLPAVDNFETNATEVTPVLATSPKLCEEGSPTKMVDPECLIEIIESQQHSGFIVNLLRYNPIPADQYPQETRYAIFHAVLEDLKTTKYKDDVSDFVITQAILRLPLNQLANSPPTYVHMCQNEINAMQQMAPTTQSVPETTSPASSSATTTKPDLCLNYKQTVDPESLLEIISGDYAKNKIQELLNASPIYLEEYQGFNTRQDVLIAVLERRRGTRPDLADEVDRFLTNPSVTAAGQLTPVVVNICYDVRYSTMMPTASVTASTSPPCASVQQGNEMGSPTNSRIPTDTHTSETHSDHSAITQNEISAVGSAAAATYDSRDYCSPDETLTSIIDVNSLLRALSPLAPKAKFIKSRIKSYIIPANPAYNYTTSEVLRDVLDTIRDDVNNSRVGKNIDFLKQFILDDGPGREPPATIYACVPKNSNFTSEKRHQNILKSNQFRLDICARDTCLENETIVSVINTDSLFDALSPETVISNAVVNRVNSYIMPIEDTKVYKKRDVLRDVLQDILKTETDQAIILEINTMIRNIVHYGPGEDRPQTVSVCFPKTYLGNPYDQIISKGDNVCILAGSESTVSTLSQETMQQPAVPPPVVTSLPHVSSEMENSASTTDNNTILSTSYSPVVLSLQTTGTIPPPPPISLSTIVSANNTTNDAVNTVVQPVFLQPAVAVVVQSPVSVPEISARPPDPVIFTPTVPVQFSMGQSTNFPPLAKISNYHITQSRVTQPQEGAAQGIISPSSTLPGSNATLETGTQEFRPPSLPSEQMSLIISDSTPTAGAAAADSQSVNHSILPNTSSEITYPSPASQNPVAEQVSTNVTVPTPFPSSLPPVPQALTEEVTNHLTPSTSYQPSQASYETTTPSFIHETSSTEGQSQTMIYLPSVSSSNAETTIMARVNQPLPHTTLQVPIAGIQSPIISSSSFQTQDYTHENTNTSLNNGSYAVAAAEEVQSSNPISIETIPTSPTVVSSTSPIPTEIPQSLIGKVSAIATSDSHYSNTTSTQLVRDFSSMQSTPSSHESLSPLVPQSQAAVQPINTSTLTGQGTPPDFLSLANNSSPNQPVAPVILATNQHVQPTYMVPPHSSLPPAATVPSVLMQNTQSGIQKPVVPVNPITLSGIASSSQMASDSFVSPSEVAAAADVTNHLAASTPAMEASPPEQLHPVFFKPGTSAPVVNSLPGASADASSSSNNTAQLMVPSPHNSDASQSVQQSFAVTSTTTTSPSSATPESNGTPQSYFNPASNAHELPQNRDTSVNVGTDLGNGQAFNYPQETSYPTPESLTFSNLKSAVPYQTSLDSAPSGQVTTGYPDFRNTELEESVVAGVHGITLPTLLKSDPSFGGEELTMPPDSLQGNDSVANGESHIGSEPVIGTEETTDYPKMHRDVVTMSYDVEDGKLIRETTEIHYETTEAPEITNIIYGDIGSGATVAYMEKSENFMVPMDFDFLKWPIVLKPKTNESCFDARNEIDTSPVLLINVTSLFEALNVPEGSELDEYLTATYLTSLDTYYKLLNFEFHGYRYKEEFLRGILLFLLTTEERSDIREPIMRVLDLIPKTGSNPLHLGTFCNYKIFQKLPKVTEKGVMTFKYVSSKPCATGFVRYEARVTVDANPSENVIHNFKRFSEVASHRRIFEQVEWEKIATQKELNQLLINGMKIITSDDFSEISKYLEKEMNCDKWSTTRPTIQTSCQAV